MPLEPMKARFWLEIHRTVFSDKAGWTWTVMGSLPSLKRRKHMGGSSDAVSGEVALTEGQAFVRALEIEWNGVTTDAT